MLDDRTSKIIRALKLIGSVVAGIGLVAGVAFAVVALSQEQPGPYLSLTAWLLLPAVFYLGLILLLTASLWEQRHRHRLAPQLYPEHPRIDFNEPRVRAWLYVAFPVTLAIVCASAVSAYQVYEFTESTAFCAETCHSVMAPERVTHRISPHARVACSRCHVGQTPAQYVQAKLYGLKELYSLVTHSYPTPIPTPIHVMEPVRENCTGCHWERNYWGKVHRDYSHYITANHNQLWALRMNVKVGGMYRFGGEGEGIHWHMKIEPKVYYIATDEKLQKIPWVKLVTKDAEEIIYQSTENPLSKDQIARYEVRKMVCVDCHNRPAHQFKAPILAIDEAMARGWIDPTLPGVKAKGVELLAAQGYTTQEQAAAIIREQFLAFYEDEHSEIFKSRKEKVERAAETLAGLYRQNFFPEMKADWRSYPDNIGHFLSDGCFRCHDGLHVSSGGKPISNDCSLCHDIVVQGPPDELERSADGLQFRHPFDFGVPIQEMGRCTECHNGALGN